MRRTRAPDAKFAPKNWGEKATPVGLSDAHAEKVLARLESKTAKRGQAFAEEARTFVREWRAKHMDGFNKDTPEEIVMATILAVSIRRGMRGDEDERTS